MSYDGCSPRRTSSGHYATTVRSEAIYSNQSYSQPGWFQNTYVRDENPLIAEHNAHYIVSQFFASLPSRSWIGKLVFDVVMKDYPTTPRLCDFAQTLWQILIDCDEGSRELSYGKVGTVSVRQEVDSTLELLDSCWEKMRRIVYDAATIVAQRNPAYMRSTQYSVSVFVDTCISVSVSDKSLRMRWVRLKNLMNYMSNLTKSVINSVSQ